MSSDLEPSSWPLESIFCSFMCCIASLGFLLPKLHRASIILLRYSMINFQISFVFFCQGCLTFKWAQQLYLVHWLWVTSHIFISLISPSIIITGLFFLPSLFDVPLSKNSLKHITQTNTKQQIIIHCICKTLKFKNLFYIIPLILCLLVMFLIIKAIEV